MELQFDRYREVAGLNRHEVTPADLTAQLKDKNPEIRASAAQRLAVYRTADAAPALAACLNDTVREVRVASAIALAACGTRDSVGALAMARGDADAIVREAAAMALENLTGQSDVAVPDWNAIESNLVALVERGDRDQVRRAAVALGHVGRSDKAKAALRAYLSRERDKNPYPQWRRSHQGDNARFNALSEANPRTLQAVARALGAMKDEESVPLLAETLAQHSDPATGNLFLAVAVAEALGRMGTPAAENALIKAFTALKAYPQYTGWYGDHSALIACHASPLHYFILEALDNLESTNCTDLIPAAITSLPTDPDRALMFENDDYETLVGRVVRRNDAGATVVETCLALLGDVGARKTASVEQALRHVHGAWAGTPGVEHRAAQILSIVCRDGRYAPRILAALDRYRKSAVTIPRVFDHGIPVVQELPVKHWVCFFLARTSGYLKDARSVDGLLASLEESQPEAAGGSPDPLGPGVLFLHNDLTPCWRAAVAWALGRIGNERAAPALLKIAGDLRNAPDTRYAAAVALGRVGGASMQAAVTKLATDYPEMSTKRALMESCKSMTQAKGTSP